MDLAGSKQGRRFRGILVVAELALSLMLLAAAGITLKSFLHLLGGDLGFTTDHVLTLRVLLPESKYKTDAEQLAFSNQVVERMQALPGVISAGTVTFLPLSGWRGGRPVTLEGQSVPENQQLIALWELE